MIYAPTYCPSSKCDPCQPKGLTGTAQVTIGNYPPVWIGSPYAVQVNISATFTMNDGSSQTIETTVSESGFIYGGATTLPIAVSQSPFGPPAGTYTGYTITSPSAYVIFGGPGGTFSTSADVTGLSIG